jgi:hypothetical protein
MPLYGERLRDTVTKKRMKSTVCKLFKMGNRNEKISALQNYDEEKGLQKEWKKLHFYEGERKNKEKR